jgi:hypothetical protein
LNGHPSIQRQQLAEKVRHNDKTTLARTPTRNQLMIAATRKRQNETGRLPRKELVRTGQSKAALWRAPRHARAVWQPGDFRRSKTQNKKQKERSKKQNIIAAIVAGETQNRSKNQETKQHCLDCRWG